MNLPIAPITKIAIPNMYFTELYYIHIVDISKLCDERVQIIPKL